MGLNNLLIAYNGGAASDAALRTAILMAKKHNAHLTCVLAHGVSNVSRNIPSWFSSDMAASIQAALSHKAEAVEAKFRDMTLAKLPQSKVHWIEVAGEPDRTIADYAMLYDLTILGQFENLVEADELELRPGRVALLSGRPVLLVPKTFDVEGMNDRALLAWDGNRTVTRALAAALPVLKTMQSVVVTTVEDGRTDQPLSGITVEAVLDRHHIPTEREFVPAAHESTADLLLKACERADAGLLVMGAFENSSLKQELLGGVTRDILKSTKIPVLMSH